VHLVISDARSGLKKAIGTEFQSAARQRRGVHFKRNVLSTVPKGSQDVNWLPTPPGRFKLMFRVYLPGAAILDGTYHLPPVVRTQ
jgi:hypothetical protein